LSRTWDLTALINAVDASAGQAERHLWLVRALEWLRHAPTTPSDAERTTPLPAVRLRLLLTQLERQPELRARVQAMLQASWREIDAAALFADFGFGQRQSLGSEIQQRLLQRVLPGTPETADLAALFLLLFRPEDADWIGALDLPTLQRLAELMAPAETPWRHTLLDAVTILVSAVHAAGHAPALRQRMDRTLVAHDPFRQLAGTADSLRRAVLDGRHDEALQLTTLLRALLDACRQAAASVAGHLEEFGVSVDIVFEMQQLRARTLRIEALLDCVIAPMPLTDLRRVVVDLVHVIGERRGLGPLLARHYALLARLVAERSAETGEHYITRDRGEYRAMLHSAAGGGAVIAGTTFLKFAVAALGMTVFWTGFWSGVNYAASFVLVMLLHWTVATKQPAMTAPALAASLPSVSGDLTDEGIEAFVDRVAQLIRSQMAGIVGNLVVCGPLVLALQLLSIWVFDAPLVGEKAADYVLHGLTLLGPTALFAAFTGVLLFASSLIAGWAENWFVFHRLDSALAWNPRIVATLGAPRARRWAAWWRANISGLAANISLGMMLGLVPALFAVIGLPVEVRHVTLGIGQLGAAVGALGWEVFGRAAFWWCVAGIAVTGLLNVGVSFALAMRVAVMSRGVRLKERDRVRTALWRRLRQQPMSFLRPPKAG
jgi:site-specific recombinase